MLLGRSPLRISFVGGGTDLEEYHNKYDGYSISATIDRFAFVAAKLRNDNLFQAFSPDYHTYFSSKKLQNAPNMESKTYKKQPRKKGSTKTSKKKQTNSKK